MPSNAPAFDQDNRRASPPTFQQDCIFHARPSTSCTHMATEPSCVQDAITLDGIPKLGRQATSRTMLVCCSSSKSHCFFHVSAFASKCQTVMRPSAPAETKR